MTAVGIGWLAQQCDPELSAIWSDEYNIRLERRLWLEVLHCHIVAGVAPEWTWNRYAEVRHDINLDSIRRRERTTRHDVKARIEEFCALAGGIEYIHLGMTSADVVDNCAQIKIRRSLQLLCDRHPAAHDRLAHLLGGYPLRGIKGPMGTMQDQIDLLGSLELARWLEGSVATAFGFERVLEATGQVYHRSLDLQMFAPLCGLPIPAPWSQLVLGYVGMISGYSGETWNEGDVSTSVTRRVCLPGALFAAEIGLQTHEHNTNIGAEHAYSQHQGAAIGS